MHYKLHSRSILHGSWHKHSLPPYAPSGERFASLWVYHLTLRALANIVPFRVRVLTLVHPFFPYHYVRAAVCSSACYSCYPPLSIASGRER